MRISDWSSDVCSSDLGSRAFFIPARRLGPFWHAIPSIAHQAQHFLAAELVVKEAAEEAARHHADAGGADAAAGHAAVLRVDHHRDALRLQMVPDALRNLGRQAFLHLKTTRLADIGRAAGRERR